MDNETKISLSFKNSITGNAKLDKYADQLERIYGVVSALDKGQSKTLKIVQESAAKTTKKIKETENATAKLGKRFDSAFSVVGIAAFTNAATRLFTSLSKMATQSSSYIENVNLLEVAYKNANETIEESSERIETFIDKMAEVYGFDESRLTRQFGIFKQLANAMELPAEEGERLSEIMVKMTNDVASLYNLDLERASNALQSALVGQTRPIRGATGADITEKTLQRTVDALGLDREMSQLSFVEKRLIMVISLTNQLKVSQGDYARTIESASNQIRVMKEQWDRLSRAVGNVFYPILQKILPYINAVLMVLTEIFNILAALFGFEMPEFDYSSLSGTSDAALDLMENLDGASESVDKLGSKMKGLRGFDKLNVINTPSGTGGGGGISGGGSGIDPKIMDAFNKAFEDYDDLMGSVQMKARDIMKDIMHWLGFTEEIDEETGKIVWKYQGIWTTLKNMWDTFWDLPAIVKLIIGGGIFKGIKKIWDIGKKLFTTVTTFFKGTNTFKALQTILDFSKVTIGGEKTGILGGIEQWEKTASKAERIKVALEGIVTNATGLVILKTSFDDINTSGANFLNTLGLLGGSMTTLFGGIMTGASIGGATGAVIGGLGGLFEVMISAALNYQSELDKLIEKSEDALEEVKDKAIEIKEDIADTEMHIASDLSETNYHEKLLDELNSIIDANGNIKAGYEDRANYILGELSKAYGVEYDLVDGTLKNQDEFNDKVQTAIRLKEQEIILEAYKEDYLKALQRQNELYDDIIKNEDSRKETLQILDHFLEDTGVTYQQFLDIQDKYNKGLELSAEDEKILAKISSKRAEDEFGIFKGYEEMYQNYDDAVTQSRINYYNNNDLINKYSDYSAAVQSGNLDKINEARDNYTKTWVKDGQVITNSDKTEQGKQIETYKATIEKWKRTNDERYESYKQTLLDVSNYTGEISPEIAQKWAALGQLSEEEFLTELAKLPDNVKQNVVDKMQEQGRGIGDKLQQGINEKFPSITIKPSIVQPTQTEINNYASKLSSRFTSVFGFQILKTNAGGGMFVNGSWKDITQYASGGNPTAGQMFVARERGPELVGNIGSHTAVMNNVQIVDSVADGVYRAVKAANSGQASSPQVFNIYLDKNTKIATYVLDQLDEIAKSNGKPIEIGG